MKLYTINATPVQSKQQYQSSLKGAMPSDKILTDTEVAKFNDLAIAKYPAEVARILKSYAINGFTIYEVQGYWQGKAERSFKIEIATEDSHFIMGELCNELRDKYKQDSVMLTLPNGEVEFI